MSRALVLSGGAFRGAVQLPVIEYLFQLYDYDAVYGVSVGSLNGVMAAQHKLKKLRNLWENIAGVSDFLTLKWYWPFIGLYSMKPLRGYIEENVFLQSIKIPFNVGVVSFTDGEYYSIASGELNKNKEIWDAIEASCCIAGLMVPPKIKINGEEHIGADGGWRNISPIPQNDSYEYIDVVTCTPLNRMTMSKAEYTSRDILSTLTRGFTILEDEIFDKDFLEIQKCQSANLRVFAPQENPGPQFKADSETIKKRLQIGEETIKHPVVFRPRK